MYNQKFIKAIKDMIKTMQGRGRDENKKLEGTFFGFPKNAILDYPFLYLEKVFVLLQYNLICIETYIFKRKIQTRFHYCLK
jgi:hypothetical protein